MNLIAYKIDVSRRNLAALNSEKEGGYAIEYKCDFCGTPTCIFLGKTELFCHNCGESLHWNVLQFISPKLSTWLKEFKDDVEHPEKAELFEEGLLNAINKYNNEHSDELSLDPEYTNYWTDEVSIS